MAAAENAPEEGRNRGLRAIAAADASFSPLKAMGGVRGLIESSLPIVAFSAVYGVTSELRPSVITALVIALGGLLLRVVTRQPVMPAVSGLIGLAIGAGLAMRTGRDEYVFLPSLVKNSLFLVVYSVSALVRWPLIGVFLGMLLGEQTTWRAHPARLRAYTLATWIWAGMFGLRLAVQAPLFLAGETALLAVLQIPLGLPLFGLVLLLTWLVVRQVPVVPASGTADEAAEPDRPPGDPARAGVSGDAED